MAEASRRRALAEFSWQAVVPRYEALWRDLSAEAARAPEPQGPAPAYDEPDYQRAFGHFASDWLTGDVELMLTDRGAALVASRAALPLHYNAHWHYLDVQLLERILVGFVKSRDKGRGLSLARVAQVIAKDCDARVRARVLRHVMWLVKYGFVRAPHGA